MVSQKGEISNSGHSLLLNWNEAHKEKSEGVESAPEVIEFESILKTLEDWADYLENDVPYFQEGPK